MIVTGGPGNVVVEELRYLVYNVSGAWYPQALSVDVLDKNHSAHQTGFKLRQHYIRTMHPVLSVSALCETSHFCDDYKVIGLPGYDTMSSRGWLATRPQISYTPSVHKSTAPGRLWKGIFPARLYTDYADYRNTNRSCNPSSGKSAPLSPCRPRMLVYLSGLQGAVTAFRTLFI